MANNEELEFSLSIDTEALKQGLSEAERLMAQGVERMNQMGNSPQAIGGSSPVPFPGIPVPQSGASAVEAAREEMERIRQIANTSPDVALASLVGMGGGGLRSRVVRGAMADPDSSDDYQQLLASIKELTKSIHQTIKESEKQQSDPNGGVTGGLLGMIRGNQMLGAVGMVGSNIMSGNVLGAGGSAIGGLIGFGLGGPGGAMAGSAIGGMVGSGTGAFLSGADEGREYSKLTADIAARFGDFKQEEGLKLEQINKLTTSGYSPQETAQLMDRLRETHVIDSVSDRATSELVQSIQELTRATGINTDALTSQYSSYKNTGGRNDVNSYMAMMISGAVSSGMRSHLQEYSELVGSARMSLVMRTAQSDVGDGALKALQGTLTNLLGGNSDTAQLLRKNPALAQQVVGKFLSTGAAEPYSYDSVAMQLAGIERGRTDAPYVTPERQVENAAMRSMDVFNKFLGSGLGILGMTEQQLIEAVKKDPNFLRSKINSENPNKEQRESLQDALNVQFMGQFHRTPTAEEYALMMQLGTAGLSNGGKLDLNAPAGDGKTFAELIKASQETEGDKTRRAEADRHSKIMEFMNNFSGLLTSIDRATADVVGGVNELVNFVKPIGDFITGKNAATPTQMTQGSTLTLGGANPKPTESSKIDLSEAFRKDPLFGDNPLIGDKKPSTGSIFDKNSTVLPVPVNPSLPNIPNDRPPRANIDQTSTPRVKFDDTPPDGILSRPGFDTFQFAHGDVVYASPTASTSREGMTISSTIVVNLTVPGGADQEWIRGAARSGVQSGQDEFLAQLETGRLDPRNRPRINNAKY